ncbi:MAG: RNA polymerase sigma factor [Saprospiraceae bacterium]|nr:RNA polymerase sigma factor [Saprospiraceae bacterium]
MSETSSIVNRLVRKEKQAQKEFYQNHYSRFMQISLRYVRTQSDALTIVNDSFMKIFNSIEKLKNAESLIPWSSTMVRNTTLDYVRKRVKYDQRHTDMDEIHTIVINDALESLSLQEIMKQIHSLSDHERIVFSMFAIDGYKHKEIAKELNISEGTSKWYLNQARKNLQELLKPYM